MDDLKLSLSHSELGFGFIIYRNTKITFLQYVEIKNKLKESLDKILKEVLD